MPSLTHNTPALRFPGYTGVWEQRPQLRFKNKNGEDYPNWEKDILDNVGTFIKGAPLSKNDISEKGTPFILYGELYTTYNEITKHVVRRTKTDVADRYYSIAGDVVIPASGETPDEISTATCVMKDGVILAGDLLIYRTIDTIDGRMMSYIINHQINNDISRIAQGKSVVHIQAKELGQITFECPSLAEQQKIADFFSKLDDLLALHQRQTQKLKKLKQGLLHEMFPREGESVPRLRFPGFTTTWKQQKVEEIADCLTGHIEKEIGDVLLPVSGYSPHVLARTKCVRGAYTINGDVNIIRPHQEVNGQFLSLSLNSGNDLIRLVQGSIGKRIPFMDVKDKVTVLLPELEEQQKIAEFFNAMSPLCEKNMGIVDRALLRIKDRFLRMMFIS